MAKSGQRVSKPKRKNKQASKKKKPRTGKVQFVKRKIHRKVKLSRGEKQRRKKISEGLKRYHRKQRRIKRKAEREEREARKQPELTCKTLYDGEALEDEHFWSNVRHLIGDSIGNQLARIPAEEGIVKVSFRVVSAEEFGQLMKDPGSVEPGEMGEIVSEEWESDLDLELFWSTYFDHARALLPKNKEGESGGSLLVVNMGVCYQAGQVSAD